jgi:hypothetical protein
MAGFWKTVLGSQKRRAVQTKQREAEAKRVNASKTFHRTGHNLREADKLDRQAERMQASVDRDQAQARAKWEREHGGES